MKIEMQENHRLTQYINAIHRRVRETALPGEPAGEGAYAALLYAALCAKSAPESAFLELAKEVFALSREILSAKREASKAERVCADCEGAGFLHPWSGEPIRPGQAIANPDEQRCKICKGLGKHEESALLIEDETPQSGDLIIDTTGPVLVEYIER